MLVFVGRVSDREPFSLLGFEMGLAELGHRTCREARHAVGCMRRVFAIDKLICSCGGPVRKDETS